MAGGPRSSAGIVAAAPVEVFTVVVIVALGWLGALGTEAADPLRPWLGSATLAVALRVVGAPSLWVLMALTPAAALLPMLLIRPFPAMAFLPLVVDVAAVQVAASLASGRLTRGGLAAVDAAALSPFVALWLYPHAVVRLGRAGRAGPWLAAVVSGSPGPRCACGGERSGSLPHIQVAWRAPATAGSVALRTGLLNEGTVPRRRNSQRGTGRSTRAAAETRGYQRPKRGLRIELLRIAPRQFLAGEEATGVILKNGGYLGVGQTARRAASARSR